MYGYHPWWPADDYGLNSVYLPRGMGANEVGILPDTGAHDDLCGEQWARRLAVECKKARRKAIDVPLQEARTVQGVGNGVQRCTHEVQMTMGMRDVDGNHIEGEYRAPCINGSNVPGLMGIKTLKAQDALIRCRTGEMWWLGQGGVDIRVSPGTKHFQMKESPGGHWLLPVNCFLPPGQFRGPSPAEHHVGMASSSTAPTTSTPWTTTRPS